MPGLEGAIEPRSERRERTDGGPQGPERRPSDGAAGGADEAVAHTVSMKTSEGEERFAVLPARTRDGKRIPADRAMEMARAGELEPVGIFSTMEEAERMKARLRGGTERQERPGGGGGGMAKALGADGQQAAGMGGLEAALKAAAEEPPDKQRAKRQMGGRGRGRD